MATPPDPGNLPAMQRIVPLSVTKHYGLDHHIWNNNGAWWVHFSVTRRGGPAKRIRLSLETKSKAEARRRRDQIMPAKPERVAGIRAGW